MNKRIRMVLAGGFAWAGAFSALAANFYWNQSVTDGNWGDASSWCTDAAGTTAATSVPGANDVAYFSGDSLGSTPITVRLTDPRSVSSLQLSGSGLNLTFKGTATNNVLNCRYNATTFACTDSTLVFDTLGLVRGNTLTLGGSGTTVSVVGSDLNNAGGELKIPAGCVFSVSGGSTVTASSLTFTEPVTVAGGSVLQLSGAASLVGKALTFSGGSKGVFKGDLSMTGGTCLTLDASQVLVLGNVILGSQVGGDRLVFSGKNPVFRCTGTSFKGHNYKTHTDNTYIDFIVPEGGFAAAPLQCDTTNPFLKGTNAAYPVYFNVLATSPALSNPNNDTCPLVSAPAGMVVDNVRLDHETNAVDPDKFILAEDTTSLSVWKSVSSYHLELSVNNPAAGSLNGTSGDFAPGTTVGLKATPNAGYGFIRWMGDIGENDPASAEIEVVMDQARTIQAVFGGSFLVDSAEALKSALDSCNDGDEIVVASGTYELAEALAVTNAIVLRGQSGHPEDVRFVYATGAARLLTLGNALAEVRAVTFVGGNTTGSLKAPAGCGRQAYVTAGTLRNCIFRDLLNLPGASGQYMVATAVHLEGADALMTGCVVSNNSTAATNVTSGNPYETTPGVYVDGGARVERTLVAGNTDNCWYQTYTKFASGILVENGTVDHCTVVNNVGFNIGGVQLLTASAHAKNCVVEGNRSVRFHGDSDDADAASLPRFADSVVGSGDLHALFADWDGGDYRAMPGSVLETGDAGYAFVTGDAVKVACACPEGFVGSELAFRAGVSGCVTAACCRWSFGDGSDPVVTTAAEASHRYAAAGAYDVALEVLDGAGAVLTRDVKKGFVKIGPAVAAVDSVAALRTALAETVDGAAVVLAKGTYDLDGSVVLEKAVTLRGATGNPEDVVLHPLADTPAVVLNAAGARVESVAITDGSYTGYAARAPEGGLAVSILPGGGVVSNCVIRGNALSASVAAYKRAAMVMATGARAMVTHCRVTGNEASSKGTSALGGTMNPGVALYEGALLANTLVSANVDTGSKGSSLTNAFACGVYVDEGSIVNCTIAGNESKWDVGGVNLKSGSARNTVVAGNRSAQSVSGDCDDILLKQATRYDHSQIGGDTDALFLSTRSWRPRPSGALVDAGSDEELSVPAVDLWGRARVRGAAIDIGAFEEQGDGLMLLVR